ncbi:MAG TPA: response regulator, partial [Gammaproteobacteria bacterium]|nr:response regulator [Gammaproteobacteria bacterium]
KVYYSYSHSTTRLKLVMEKQTVFIVDDDESVRESLSLLLNLKQFKVRAFSSAQDFLTTYQPTWPGCLLLDIRMPGMSGLEMQAELVKRAIALPVIMLTAHGDVATTRTALKTGAFDFLEKPVDDDLLLDVVSNALSVDTNQRATEKKEHDQSEKISKLTNPERQVMDLLTEGRHNREIAESLGISPRTVEVYRARMMEKLQARNLADMIRMVLEMRNIKK